MSHIGNIILILESYSSIKKVYLYGSRNGISYKANSDYDICIVLSSVLEKDSIVASLGTYMINSNLIIHPIFMTVDEYLEKSSLSIYKNEIFACGTILIEKNN